ncbi:MAG: arsenate reductase ArsC, partial [Erysipelotrichaceae bacterium]
VHNFYRRQIAEALGKEFGSDRYEFYSAGTEIKSEINQDAVRPLKKMYGIDMEKTQYSKTISDIVEVDIIVTMGCNVRCPIISHNYKEDWGLYDPSGKSDEEFLKVIKQIEINIKEKYNAKL